MKKTFTKAFALILMGVFATTMAFAQGAGGHDHTNVEKYESGYTKGPEWELFHFPEYDSNGNIVEVDGKTKLRSINYYNGGKYDDLTIDKFKGGHWKGHTIDELKEGEEFFLCNMETGEYLQIGDYWGTNEMTNHVGITYQLTKAYSQRKKENNPAWNGDPAFGYWLSPKMPGSDMPNRVIGRVTVNDGEQGHFERNKYFVLRDRDEYHDGKYVNWQNNANDVYTSGDKDYDGSSISDPGGFLFYFYPVEKDGKQAYIIYTHRQTQYANSSNKNRSEFWDRESYLMLKSAGHLRTGYNAVRFEKFAGQMSGKSEASYNGIKLNFSRKVSVDPPVGVAPSNVSVSVKNLAGTPISGASAELVSITEGYLMNKGQSAITGGTVLAPNSYGNGENSEIVYTFRVTLPSSYKFNAAALDVYNMSSEGKAQQLSNNEGRARNFQFFIKMGSSTDELSAFAEKTEETNIVDGANVPNSFGGLRYGTQQLVVGTEVSSATEFYIQVTLKKTSAGGCYAGIGEIQLYDSKNVTVNNGGTWGDYRDEAIGDETNFTENYVSITDALDEKSNFYVGKDKNNLWKIVTKAERERFRLVASEDKPSDMTYRIYNPKFYTSYTYVWKKDQCTDLGGGKYTYQNDLTDYHWQWFDDDRKTHLSPKHHVHPYDITYDDTRANEYHKIGTGFFHRFWASGIGNANVKERAMTLGQESNYVGSIWKGTANLQQEVGTLTNPLREGLYVVCVKGFFAPHDMEKYDGATATTSALSTSDEWYKEAIITNGGEDNGKWRRSHDSYLFAWSNPDGKNPEEVRRMLPSIYEGAIDLNSVSEAEKKALSKEDYLETDNFKKYSQLGVASGEEADAKKNLLKDATNFAQYNGAYFSKETGTWSVPKTLSAAGRWFNVIDGISSTSSATFKNAQAYRIALPVYVGSDGLLTIGVDHTRLDEPIVNVTGVADAGTKNQRDITVNIPASGNEEWVCFDDFELIYLGKVEPDVFVVDERHGSALNMVESRPLTDGTTGEPYTEGENFGKWSNGGEGTSIPNKNNTQWKDIFSNTDIALEGKTATIVKTLVIRRTLTKNGWGSIVFPVNLTYGHLKEGFGEDVQVSKLAGFNGRIIQYEPVQRDASGNPVADDQYIIEAGVPYIIRPTIDPVIPANSDLKYKRPSFTKAYSTSPGLAGYYLRDFDRNYEVEVEMAGPIYVIPNVNVQTSVSFPLIEVEQYEVDEGSGMVQKERRKTEGFDVETLAKQDTTWASINAFDSKERLNKTYKVNRSDAPGHYKLVETAHYYAGEKIPQYSYFFSGGKMYYTTNPDGVATTRGLYSYLQLIGADDDALPVYSKPFIDGADTFIEVIGETNGIEDVNAPEPDGKLEIYDLMGRKVSNPRPGTIYIMNGVKVLWK